MENKNRQEKKAKVQEIKEKFEKAQGIVLANYHGLNVEEDTELRKKLREAGMEYKVYKNTLTTLAAKEVGFGDIEPFLEGPVSIAISYDDATAPARVLNDFAKDHKKLELKAGIIEKQIYDSEKLQVIASIPSRDVLIAKFLGSIKAPISKFACVLDAISKSKESEQ
ncbi:50S ribosomal protein L10 [Clostridium oryzae]|uniref:Large ribosomal subunit protein uL10 n=1 Tax=Clostridium oryzae TaxID=1450648 RepID=A0A1V4IKQ2_9CLOT|nr:50S ribosomal protein L10 [Clostridium oryzae]OPJ60618.1 50S ribosomal protein L10 [Clostridium oryzae]